MAAAGNGEAREDGPGETVTGPGAEAGRQEGAEGVAEGIERLKIHVGLSSFIFRTEPTERRREAMGLLERLRGGMGRWSESLGSDEGRRGSIGSANIYEQLNEEADASSSQTPTPTDSVNSVEAETRSLPGMSWFESEIRANLCELAVDTDVWTWGCGRGGQLGTGQTEDASRPGRLPNLPTVVKVSCGAEHCLALTADCKVYVWGTYYKSRRALVPQLVETDTYVVYDVAAGNGSSVLLGYIAYRPDVFLLDKNRLPVRKTELRALGWPVAPSSSFASPPGLGHCLVSQPSGPTQAGLFEAAHELNFKLRKLFAHLHNLKLSFVEPFTNIYNMDDDTALSSRVILLMNSVSVFHRTTHACVTAATQRCLATLDGPSTKPGQPQGSSGDLGPLERSLSRQLDALRFFGRTLADAAAWQTFELLHRQHPGPAGEALSHLDRPLPPPPARPAATRDIFALVLALAEEELTHAASLAAFWPDLGERLPQEVAAALRQCKEGLSAALLTAGLVAGLPAGVQAQLASRPGRRAVLDSDKAPASVSQRNGKPSSSGQRLLLFSDALVSVNGSQAAVWPLALVWVHGRQAREAHEDREGKNGGAEANNSGAESNVHAIQVSTPDELVTIYAPDEALRARWFSAINGEINRALSLRRNTGQLAPDRRFGQYTFRSGQFRGCRYDGQWLRGMMHGEGHLTWPDGSLHRGRFRRGKITGCGTRELKSPTRTQTGEWEDGLLHGFAKVVYDEDGVKSEYQGWFARGVREGHGVLRIGSDYLYIGEWQADRQHGYGVEEDYSAFPQYRFFGEWRHGLKHGQGSMVTLTNKYLEGSFVNGEMRGQGRIVDADFVFTGQIINGKPNGQGECIFKSASGCIRLKGQCFGQGEARLRFEGDVEWETLSATEAITLNRQSVYRYQTEDVDPEGELPSRWTAILRHCEHMLGRSPDANEADEEDEDAVERARLRAWNNLASLVQSAHRRWKRKDESRPSSVAGPAPRWSALECIPAPGTRLTVGYVARAQDYLGAAVELAEHPLGLYLGTMVGLVREAYLGMGTHPQLLRHAREDVWIAASGLYALARRLFPLLPRGLDRKVPLAAGDEAGGGPGAAGGDDGSGQNFLGRDFVYAVLLPRVYPCLRTLYSTTLDAEEEAYRRTLRKHNRIPDSQLFSLLEIPGDYRERLVSEYDVVGRDTVPEPTMHYRPIVERMGRLNTDELCCPIEQLGVLMRAYDDTLALMVGPGQQPPSADDQVPVILFMLIRANITHLGATLSYIRDMTAFSCECTRGITMYKFTTILGLYRHLVDRNGMLY